MRKWLKAHMTIGVILGGGGLAIFVILAVAILTILFSSVSQECDSSDSSDTTTSATTKVTGSWTQKGTPAYNTAKQIFDYWTSKRGFSGTAAAAIVGNISVEDGTFVLNQAEYGGGSGGGLYQFTPASKYLAGSKNGHTWKNDWSVEGQGDGVWWLEVSDGIGNGYKGYSHMDVKTFAHLSDISKATLQWMWGYERPAPQNTTGPLRVAGAQTAYQLFNGASIAANDSLLGGVTNTATTGTASSGDDSSSSCSTTSSTSSGTWGWPFDSVKSIQDVFKKLDSPTSEQAYGKSPQRSGDFHDGWDFGSAKYGTGSTIKAVHNGTVYKIEHKNGYWMVDVKSSDGYYEVYQEAFASRGDIAVSEGQSIKVGDKIGTLTDSHLHLGISKTEIDKANTYWNVNNGTWLNPVRLIAGQGDTTTDDYGKSAP